jgi:hypothetical protein
VCSYGCFLVLIPIGKNLYPRKYNNSKDLPFLDGSDGPWAELPLGVESLYLLAESSQIALGQSLIPKPGKSRELLCNHPGEDRSGFVPAREYPGWYFHGGIYKWVSVLSTDRTQLVYTTDEPLTIRPNLSTLYYPTLRWRITEIRGFHYPLIWWKLGESFVNWCGQKWNSTCIQGDYLNAMTDLLQSHHTSICIWQARYTHIPRSHN